MSQKKKNSLPQVRSFLYGLARVLGDAQAMARGPEAVAKRILRLAAGRATGRMFSKLFR